MAGFLKKNFPASLLQKYVFFVPFSMRINTIGFQSLYFKIKLVCRVFVAFEVRFSGTRGTANPHTFLYRFEVCLSDPLQGSTSRDVMSAQRYCKHMNALWMEGLLLQTRCWSTYSVTGVQPLIFSDFSLQL